MSAGIVIVGGGQAAVSAAAKIREIDKDVPVTLICGEPVLPYQRPPLSKKYLSGDMPLDRLILRPQDWYDENSIGVELGVEVVAIDPAERMLSLADDRDIPYDQLLIATGSAVRRLSEKLGGALDGVHYLRTTSHADNLRDILKPGCKALIVGGGYIGLEVAAVVAQAGASVVVVEMGERILQRVASAETSDYFRDLHTSNGVKILEGIGLDHLVSTDGKVTGAALSNGETMEVDCVLCGIGIMPCDELAKNSGLEVNNGIVVDANCRTSDASIFAAGDCASFAYKGEVIRLESVPNAINQAEIAVANMLGQSEEYIATPWFWSDQYNVKLQIAGLNTGYDSVVVRAGRREGAQSIWYYKGDDLLAVDAMNDAPSFMIARKVLEAGLSIPREVVADPQSNLKEYM